MVRFIERDSKTIAIHTTSAPAKYLVDAALKHLRTQATADKVDVSLFVSGSHNQWELYDRDADRAWKIKTAGGLIYHLTDRLMSRLAGLIETQHCLHAAAVSFRGRAIVMPAISGSGKSSLTTWLVANGFDYITDELVLIDKGQQVDGISRPIHIKTRGWGAIESLLETDAVVFDGVQCNVIPIKSIGGEVSRSARHDHGILLFPHFKRGVPLQLAPISSTKAGLTLIKSHINARNMKDHGFPELMRLARTSQSYAFTFGGCEMLPKHLIERLKGLLAGSTEAAP